MTEQQIAAVKQALEALKKDSPWRGTTIGDLEHILEQQPADEPVATLWQHGETGRTRVTMPGDITDCDASWFKAADLYTRPQPAAPAIPEGMALVPKRMTKAMRYVTDQGDWTWEDLLRAAEAITEAEYNLLAAALEKEEN